MNMKIVGNPALVNARMKNLVLKVIIHTERIDLRREVVTLSEQGSISVLDIGESLRETRISLSPDTSYRSLDLLTEGNPDYLADICDINLATQIEEKFDVVCCFSLLEHVHNPFIAAKNLFDLTSSNGYIIGYVPFLFPRHGPTDLAYQDFFRFTRDGIGLLFPEAKSVEVWPDRGRLATALICFSTSYKYIFEKRFPKLTTIVSKLMSSGKHQLQTSGFQFRISK